LAPIFTCLALIIFFSVYTDSFMTRDNLLNVLRQTSPLAIMAVGITFVLLCAEIDLSIAFMATLSGVITAALFKTLTSPSVEFARDHGLLMAAIQTLQALPDWLAPLVMQGIPILFAVLVTAALGYINGLGTARVGVPSFMMTLAMMLITQGLALRITQGQPIFEIPSVVSTLANGSIKLFESTNEAGQILALIEIPNITIVALVFLAAGFITLRYTRFGRYVYMVGGNRRAAEFAGVNVKSVTTTCLCISGFTAGCAGVILIGRMGSAQASGLDPMLINCISAVVLGGTRQDDRRHLLPIRAPQRLDGLRYA